MKMSVPVMNKKYFLEIQEISKNLVRYIERRMDRNGWTIADDPLLPGCLSQWCDIKKYSNFLHKTKGLLSIIIE